MPRPRKSETSTGATFATPSGTPTGISWRFNSARSDVPRVRDDFDAGRGEGDVYICMYMYIWRERGGLGSIRTCIASLWTVPPRKTDNGRDKSVTLERIFGENGPLLFFSSSRPFKRTFFNRNGMGETNVCYDIFLHFSTTCFFPFSWITLLSDVLFIFTCIYVYIENIISRAFLD